MNKYVIAILLLLFSIHVEAARTCLTGFEGNSANPWTSSGSPVVTTTNPRTGTYAVVFSSFSSGTPKRISTNMNSQLLTYRRVYIRFDTFPSAENIFWSNGTSATIEMVYLTVDSGGALRLYDEDGVIGSPSSALSTATYYRIELKIDRSGAGGTHVVEAKIDGAAAFATASNRDISAGIITCTFGANLNAEAQTQGSWTVDDIAVDTAAYPDAGSILNLYPNAAGDNTEWTPSVGNNWDTVEEIPTSDADFVSSLTLNQIDDYNLAATTADISASATIKNIGVAARGQDANGATRAVLRVKATGSGTVEESAAINFATSFSHVPCVDWLYLSDLPGASADPWTKTTLDTAQIGMRVSTGGAANLDVSGAWMVVEFVPAVASTRRIFISQLQEEITINANIENWQRVKWDGTQWGTYETQRFDKRKTKWGIVALLLSAGFDAWSTQRALSQGGEELNPVMEFAFRKPAIGWSIMIGGTAYGVYREWQRRESKQIWIASGIHTGLAMWNLTR